jgi:hypothetical protein
MYVHLRHVLLAVALLASSFLGTVVWGRILGVGASSSAGERPVAVTITPFRLVDTRPAPDGPVGGSAQPFGPGETRTYGAAGVGTVPADATGVVLNTTAVDATADSFLTLWPAGAPRPLASTLNPFPGRITFNAATVDLNATGQFSVYNLAGTVNVVIDVTGYLVDHSHDDRYYTEAEINAAFGLTKAYIDYWKPVAFGRISWSGAVVSGTSGLSSTYNESERWFEITLPGITYTNDHHVTVVTLVENKGAVTTGAVDGRLLVQLFSSSWSTMRSDFSFVTFAA